jgi:peptide/nickel transport system permease protein
VPTFLLLTLMLVLPAKYLEYAPPFGATRFFDDPGANLRLIVPPTLMLAIGGSAALMRLTRTAMLDILRQDYIRTARSKGLTERATILKHALRNGMLPVLTFMGLQLGTLLGGSIIIEQILALPGIGTWNLTAIQAKDAPIIMAVTMYAAVVLMLATLIVDLSYAVLDPRIRFA